jgi:glycosyltransferase involved in cell wall biosynthesis
MGGTEVYVASLARCLSARGSEVVIASPGRENREYTAEGLPVRRFRVDADPDLRTLYGDGDALAAESFARILECERPDLVHLHAFTAGVSVRIVDEAKRRGIPVVFTYHTPTVSCQRGTLMRWGREVCDGVLDLDLCTRCTLHGLGLPRSYTGVVGRVPVAAGKALGAAGLSGGPWTALRMRELVQLRHAGFRALIDRVDHVVALCGWVQELLLRNGVPAGKVTISRHALPDAGNGDDAPLPDIVPTDQTPLRVAFLGRLTHEKGADTLIRAVRSLPEQWIQLDIYGVPPESSTRYRGRLESLAARDPRIALRPPVANDRVVPLLRSYHVLAVPSRWLETGPLVALEAFAAGIPVVGSNLGGLAELVEDGVNGLRPEVDSVQSWASALRRLSEGRDLLTRLRAGVRPPRRLVDLAKETTAMYASLSREPLGRARSMAPAEVV